MSHFIAIADSTEINAFVIDMKDEFGLNYQTSNPDFAKNAGTANKIANLKALLDTLKAHHILPIARMVVFKDRSRRACIRSGRSASRMARRCPTSRRGLP